MVRQNHSRWAKRGCVLAAGMMAVAVGGGICAAGGNVLGGNVLFASAGPGEAAFSWRMFLAPFHSVLLHFPIGFVTVAFLADLYYLKCRHQVIQKVASHLMVLCVASSVVVASLGLLRAGGGGYEEQALRSHRFFGILITLLVVLALPLQRLAYRHENRLGLQVLYRGLMVACLATIVVTGHKGGNLTHGSSYLVKNAPYWVKAWLAYSPASHQPAAAGGNEKEKFYVEKIHPVLERRCFGCHGPEKQKNSYRLDVPEVAVKGGESEETAIVPGDPMASNLVRLILLPPDDDDAMPPEGKTPLTPAEVMDMVRWIQQGAVFVDESGGG